MDLIAEVGLSTRFVASVDLPMEMDFTDPFGI